MTRNLTVIFLLCLAFVACGQTKIPGLIDGLTIAPDIKKDVEQHIATSAELDVFKDKMQVYLISGDIQMYAQDSLAFSTKFGGQMAPFKSFYVWHGDALTIEGAFGLFGGVGFGIDIVHSKARVYHMLSSDDLPGYAYHESDSLVSRLEVPCTDTKIILSEIPDATKNRSSMGM